MNPKAKTVSPILTSILLLALVGCGSDPVTNCVSQTQALDALKAAFAPVTIDPCDEDVLGQHKIQGCSSGGTMTFETQTFRACAFKGPTATCGDPPDIGNTCNMMGRFTLDIYSKEGCSDKCFSPGDIHTDQTGVSCLTPNATTPCDGTGYPSDPGGVK